VCLDHTLAAERKVQSLKTSQREVPLRTAGGLTVTDITDEVRNAVLQRGITNGICCISPLHTSCSVRINEWECGFFDDFALLLERLAALDSCSGDWELCSERIGGGKGYEFGTDQSLPVSMLLATGESVPVRDGELCLGTWQRILLLELDPESEGRWLANVVGA
jgi:secondary thiamine-phosphate synthase enzyme